MPRDSSGNYTLPNGYLAETGQTILASQHNPPLEDLASAVTGSVARSGAGAMQGNLAMGGFKITGVGTGSNDTDAVTVAQINSLIPAGTVLDFAGSNAPNGFLLCYGQAVSRSTYSALFSAIGSTYGAGDGVSTFNIPDARGRVSAGADAMGGTAASRLTGKTAGVAGALGSVGGEESHTLGIPEIPSHTHAPTVNDPGHGHSTSPPTPPTVDTRTGGGNYLGGGAQASNPLNVLNATTGITVTVDSTGGGTSHNNIQPTIVFNKIIKF